MACPWDRTLPDQWESQTLARILIKHRVIVVTRPQMRKTVEDMKMSYAPDMEAALDMAGYDESKKLTVIPNGVSVIVK